VAFTGSAISAAASAQPGSICLSILGSVCNITARAVTGGISHNELGQVIPVTAMAISGKISCNVPLPPCTARYRALAGTVLGTGRNITLVIGNARQLCHQEEIS
jgi:hypothetical protein